MNQVRDGKYYQNLIVGCTKEKDLVSIIAIVNSLSEVPSTTDWLLNVSKMAINISANMIGSGIEVEKKLLESLHSSVEILFDSLPSMREVESIEYSYAKIKLRLGLLDSALLMALNSKEPRLRIFSSILEYCSEQKLYRTACSVLSSLRDRDLVPTETEYAHVLNSLGEESEFRSEFLKFLDQLANSFGAFESPLLVSSIKSAVVSRNIQLHENIVIAPESPICPISNLKLDRTELTETEVDEMLELTRRLIVESVPEGQEIFDRFFGPQAGTSRSCVFLDGANIAHTNQNFDKGYFRYDQIDDVLRHFDKDNDSSCVIVLHSKWTNPKKDLRLSHTANGLPEAKRKKTKRPALPQLGTDRDGSGVNPVPAGEAEKSPTEEFPTESSPSSSGMYPPMDLIERWRSHNQLLEVPHGLNDDWFWMHACCRQKGVLVSNDQMRDHFWRMRNPKFFKKFCANHVCKYTIKFDGEAERDTVPKNYYTFQPPLDFTECVQVHGRVVHVPYKEGGETRWMVFEI